MCHALPGMEDVVLGLCRRNGLPEGALASVRWRVLEQDVALSGVRHGAASQPWGEVL